MGGVSKRKQQHFRRGEREQPRPPWGWLLGGVLLLLAVGALFSGRWPVAGDQGAGSGNQAAVGTPVAGYAPTPIGTGTTGLGPGSEALEGTAQPTIPPTAPPATPETPGSPLQSPIPNLQSDFLTPGRLSGIAGTATGDLFAVAAAGGVTLYDSATLAEVHHYPTATQALAVAITADGGAAVPTVTAVTASGQLYRWPLLGGDAGGGEASDQVRQGTAQTFANVTTYLSAAVFSPGATLAAVLVGTERSGMEIRIYGMDSGELRHILPAHAGRAEQLLFLPGESAPPESGLLLLTRGADGRVRLWDSAGWDELSLPAALTTAVTVLAGGQDRGSGRILLAAGHTDGRVSVWDTGTWQEVLSVVPPEEDDPADAPRALALSPDGATVAVAGRDGALSLYEIETGEPRAGCDTLAVTRLFFLPLEPLAGAVSPSPILLTLGQDGRLRSWDPGAISCRPGQETALAASDADRPFLERVDFLAAGPEGALAVAGQFGPVFLWDVAAETVTGVVDPGGPLGALAFGPEGLVATGGEVGVRLWEASSGTLIHDPGGHVRTRPGAANVIALAFSPAETGETAGVLASADRSGLLKLWRTQDGALLRNILPEEPAPVTSLTFSEDGYFLLAGGGAGVTIWQPRRSERIRMVAPAGSAVAAPAPAEAVQATWQMIAVLRGSRIELYQEDGRYLRTVQAVPAGERAEPAPVTAAAFLRPPEGVGPALLLLAGGHDDGVIRLWDAEDGHLLATLPQHPGAVSALAAPGGCTLISAAETGTIRVDQLCN